MRVNSSPFHSSPTDCFDSAFLPQRFPFALFVHCIWRRPPRHYLPQSLNGAALSFQPPSLKKRRTERARESKWEPSIRGDRWAALHPAFHCFLSCLSSRANPCCHGIARTLAVPLQPLLNDLLADRLLVSLTRSDEKQGGHLNPAS